MSGDHFHVHGPHDHAVEHGAHSGDDFASRIAVMTAVLSTVGALFSYQGGATQNDAMLQKNAAAIKKTEASNQWNYYQAKSSKQNLSELAIVIVAEEQRDRYRQEIDRYKEEKAQIKAKADALEAEARDWDQRSDAEMHLHHRWAQATTALQVSIALAAIALLTRRRWLEVGLYGVAAIGAGLGVAAVLHL